MGTSQKHVRSVSDFLTHSKESVSHCCVTVVTLHSDWKVDPYAQDDHSFEYAPT
jgi:hypothetical protein